MNLFRAVADRKRYEHDDCQRLNTSMAPEEEDDYVTVTTQAGKKLWLLTAPQIRINSSLTIVEQKFHIQNIDYIHLERILTIRHPNKDPLILLFLAIYKNLVKIFFIFNILLKRMSSTKNKAWKVSVKKQTGDKLLQQN